MSVWVDSDEALAEVCARLHRLEAVALDTEFIRTETFFPKLALIQLSDGHTCWLIDVLSVSAYAPLKALLQESECVIILHACAEDLEVLQHALDIRPQRIFDTQLAASIVNTGFSMGYANLLETLTGVHLDKQETRSNWLARPLSAKQLNYASDDVRHLHSIYQFLSAKLHTLARQSWFDEDMREMRISVFARQELGGYHRRIKGGHRLSLVSLRALKRLCDWRERRARKVNKPRGHLIKDPVLLELASCMPEDKKDLYAIEDFRTRDVARFGDEIIEQIALSLEDPMIPDLPQPLARTRTPMLKAMRQGLSEFAERESIPMQCLASKKELESIVRSLDVGCLEWPNRFLAGWRAQLVRPAIQRLIDEKGV